LDDARNDYRSIAKKRKANSELPNAWRSLLEGPDPQMAKLLADRAASACGYPPDNDTVEDFLRTQLVLSPSMLVTPSQKKSRRRLEPLSPVETQRAEKPHQGQTIGGKFQYSLFNDSRSATSACGVLVDVLEDLDVRFPKGLLQIAGGRKRGYVSTKRSDLYPDRPDLYNDDSHVARLKSGLWVGTNASTGAIRTILKQACDAVGIKFGRDLKLGF
jgi:predicted type IV restriction endonuclease